MAERRRPDLDQVRETLREHDERSGDDATPTPPPPERDAPPAEEQPDDGED